MNRPDTFAFLRTGTEDGLLTVTIARPPVNVLHVPLMEELRSVLAAAADDVDVRGVLLTAEGTRVFSAGVEVADHGREAIDATMEAFHGLLGDLRAYPLPTVAGLNGPALGGGCELAMACDMIVAAPHARIGQPEIKLAAVAMPASFLLRGRVPSNVIAELLLGGEPISAAEAHRLGLVNRLTGDDFAADCAAFARQFTRHSRPVLALMKQALRHSATHSFEDGMPAMEALYRDTLLGLEDATEGLAAFAEKRPPQWRHR